MGVDLLQGDCLNVLKTLPDESVHAIVTDPPYLLGFMGKDWDADDGIAGKPPIWQECLRVLKPGGYLLAFGGTRTYHRMTTAIEDAGFEIRDSIHWVYGCVSDDTEILINGEWVHYRKAIEGSLALCYDVEHDTYTWLPVQQLFVYDYDDVAYRVESDSTDQIVSRNHRCLVQREGKWEFVVAEEVAREQEARVPVLETLPSLLDALRVQQSNTSGTKYALRGVSNDAAEGSASKTPVSQDCRSALCGLRDGDVEAVGSAQAGKKTDLLTEVQRSSAWQGLGATRTQGSCGVDGRVSQVVSTEDVGREQPCLEGWSDVQARQGELRRPEVRSLSAGVLPDGAEGRLRHGASAGSGDSLGTLFDSDGSGASHRSQHAEQRARELDAVCVESGSQIVRGEGFTSTSLARVTPIRYVGTVWCVKVPTGAFVARRNGKVFVTGNSGFPKSKNVALSIDKGEGHPNRGRAIPTASTYQASDKEMVNKLTSNPVDPYEAKSEIAKQWEGWGTALKPSHEPVVVARKSLDGTVASNVLTHGTGGMNIDGCRVDGGRWPPNLLLSHTEDCAETCADDCPVTEMDRQNNGASRFFPVFRYQAKASRSEREAGCDGLPTKSGAEAVDRKEGSAGMQNPRAGAGRTAASVRNYHPTVKPVALMEWLITLVTPPNGTVLDPFMGSGTTGIAAVRGGFGFIGIEREEGYFQIAETRIKAASSPSADQEQPL